MIYYAVQLNKDGINYFYNFSAKTLDKDFTLSCLTFVKTEALKVYYQTDNPTVRVEEYLLTRSGVTTGPKVLENDKILSLRDVLSLGVTTMSIYLKSLNEKQLDLASDQWTAEWKTLAGKINV